MLLQRRHDGHDFYVWIPLLILSTSFLVVYLRYRQLLYVRSTHSCALLLVLQYDKTSVFAIADALD